MQRKRSELVPIAEAFSDLSGPVKAIRDDSPQARHSFTVADQVNQLVSASEADPDRGFMARLLALCSLPRLLLAWVCTEAVRTQSRELVLGDSLVQKNRSGQGESHMLNQEALNHILDVNAKIDAVNAKIDAKLRPTLP